MKLEKEMMKRVKRTLKQHTLLCLFENLEGSQVIYNSTTGMWDISVQVGFEIPAGLEIVQNGFEEDLMQESIQSFLALKENHLQEKIQEYFDTPYKPLKASDANLTYIFPPCFIARKGEQYYRLMTKEESEKISADAPSLEDMMKREFELLEDGMYEFIPNTSVEEYEHYAFRLKKYSSIRARYSFSIEHEKLQGFYPNDIKPIFEDRKKQSA